MRFARLDIPAFGPFTDLLLELDAGASDCHVIYGPNEAGKSSLLRAVQAILYGIPMRTTDDFLHPYSRLRLGGELVRADGTALAFHRLKRNKEPLVDTGGAPLPDDALAPFLGAVGADYFASMFRLDAAQLRAGAADLLAGHGDVGEALFAASAASGAVHRVLDRLRVEADGLFRPSGKNQAIASAARAHAEAKRAMRDATVEPRAWAAAEQAERAAGADRERLAGELHSARERLTWLADVDRALPVLARFDDARQRLAALPATPGLDAAFVAEAGAALQARKTCAAELHELQERVAELAGAVAANAPRGDVLERAAEIADLHARLEAHRERVAQLARERERQAQALAELLGGLRELGLPDDDPGSIAGLRVPLADLEGYREAGAALAEARSRQAGNADELARLEAELAVREAELRAAPPDDNRRLGDLLDATTDGKSAEEGLATRRREVAAAARRRDAELRALGTQPGAPAEDAAAMYALVAPSRAALREAQGGLQRLADELARAGQRSTEAEREAAARARELARLQRAGELPTLAELAAARAHRDAAWARVRAAWKEGAGEGELDGLPLAEAYPDTVAAADGLADRLRVEAGKVAQAEALREQRDVAAQEAQRAREQAAQARQTHARRLADWQALWAACGIVPASPEVMLEWRDRWEHFRAEHEAWLAATEALAAAEAAVDSARGLLAAQLPDLHEAAVSELRRAVAALSDEIAERRGEHRSLQKAVSDLQQRLAEQRRCAPRLEADLAAAHANWEARRAAARLPAEIAPGAGLAVLERRAALVRQFDAYTREAERMAERQHAADVYLAQVATLAGALHVPPGGVEVRVAAIHALLDEARRRQTRREEAEQRLAQETAKAALARRGLEQAETAVAAARTATGAADDTALAGCLATLAERHAREAECERERSTLLALTRGRPLDDFIARLREVDGTRASADLAAADAQVQRLAAEHEQAVTVVAHAARDRTALERTESAAAAHRQAQEHAAARLRLHAARHLRLQLAIRFLTEQITRFRETHQGPLIERASAIFAAVTGGAFSRLVADFAGDAPVLLGVRGGELLTVEQLSEGTRDQLFLALRIAAIEHHLRAREPLPVLLDDLLASSDEARSEALLPVLCDLGRRTQVLLFTHHRWLAERVRAHYAAGEIRVHELPARGGAAA